MPERTHELKCWPSFFQAIADGRKTFEVRRNDRNFAVGDRLIIREWRQDVEQYTGRCLSAYVSYALHDHDHDGIQRGFVVLGLKEVRWHSAILDCWLEHGDA